MKKLFLILFCSLALAKMSGAGKEVGNVDIEADKSTLPVYVTGSTPELQQLAVQAFSVHGRYRLVQGNSGFHIAFSLVSQTQVRVDITKGTGAAVASEVVSGSTTRNALLRAADLAVTKTSGLKGFFAGKLAFVSTRTGHSEIYVSDLFGGETFSVTRGNADILSPRWSPDGSKIIYTSYFKSGFPDIFAADTAGYAATGRLTTSSTTTIVSVKGTNSGARYSPDGRSIAMVLSGEGNPEVYVSNAAGKQLRRLTNNTSVEASPCFSPDGSRIVVTSDQLGKPQLFLMSASGGSMERLSTNVSNYCAEPDWSRADPDKIVFTAGMGSGFQVAIYSFASHSAKIVSHAAGDAQEPVWLADGRHVIYTAKGAGTRRLWILDTENLKATPLSPSSLGNCSQATYLPAMP